MCGVCDQRGGSKFIEPGDLQPWFRMLLWPARCREVFRPRKRGKQMNLHRECKKITAGVTLWTTIWRLMACLAAACYILQRYKRLQIPDSFTPSAVWKIWTLIFCVNAFTDVLYNSFFPPAHDDGVGSFSRFAQCSHINHCRHPANSLPIPFLWLTLGESGQSMDWIGKSFRYLQPGPHLMSSLDPTSTAASYSGWWEQLCSFPYYRNEFCIPGASLDGSNDLSKARPRVHWYVVLLHSFSIASWLSVSSSFNGAHVRNYSHTYLHASRPTSVWELNFGHRGDSKLHFRLWDLLAWRYWVEGYGRIVWWWRQY